MKAELIVETGFEMYYAIEIKDIPNINGKPSIILRTAVCEYNGHADMINIFNEIVDRINKGDTNDR